MLGIARRLACASFVVVLLLDASSALAACGDGILDQNEECDPGGALFIDGDPGQGSCTTGTDCFYEATCCKFNCQFVGSGAPCFDANECTTDDTCDQVGNCSEGINAPGGSACDDGLFCTATDTCNGSGSCVGAGSPCTAVECQGGCNEGSDSCEILEGQPCTSDGNACTDDVCNQAGSCTHPNNSAPCNDGIFCNGVDTCSAGSCGVHAGDPCTGGGQCANVCNEAGDTCNLPNGTGCNDGLFCTDTDACAAGACVGSGDPCAGGPQCADTCNEGLDTCNLPNGTACNDNLFCTDTDACAAGACVGSGDPCAGGPQCADTCNEGLDTCNLPNGTACNDGLFCTSADACSAGACVGSGDPCTGGGQCADTCDEGLDTCNIPNGTPCDDGLFCTTVDTCTGGICSGTGDPCAGGQQCADTCDEGLDTCDLPNGTLCSDGLFCTALDVCLTGVCVGMDDPCAGGGECANSCDEIADTCSLPAGIPCTDDANLCTDDACDGFGACAHPANNEPCDDGLLCTLVDFCQGGACVGQVPPECQDANPCTFDTCDDANGDCLNLEEPAPTCREAGLSQLVIGNRDDVPGRDKLKWKWARSVVVTDHSAFGTPDASTTYDLCIYDTSTDLNDVVTGRLVKRLTVPPNPAWDEKGSNKWFYKNFSGTPDGITLTKLRSGGAGAIGLKATGANLDIVALGPNVFFSQDPTVAVQMINSEGECWVTKFDTAKKNTDKKFKTRFLGIVIQ